MQIMNDVHDVLKAIQEPDAFGGNPPFWAEAMVAMPASKPVFLDFDALSARRAAAGMPSERDSLMEAEMVAATEALEFERAALLRDQIRELKGGPAAPPPVAARGGKRKPTVYPMPSKRRGGRSNL